jgi:hypothetical protein
MVPMSSFLLMPRTRRYFRRGNRGAGQRYSSETSCFNLSVVGLNQATQVNIVLVPATLTYGVRKVKNPIVQFGSVKLMANEQQVNIHAIWVLVFVPEGTSVGTLQSSANPAQSLSLYEPNQNVIAQGIGTSMEPVLLRSRLARNLQADDAIYLVIGSVEPVGESEKLHAHGTVNFAITY